MYRIETTRQTIKNPDKKNKNKQVDGRGNDKSSRVVEMRSGDQVTPDMPIV